MSVNIKMAFNPEVASDVGTDAAIILSNIEFWQATNKANDKNYFDGNYWTYNSVKAFNELFSYLTPAKIRRCLDKLEENGYIISGNYNKSSYDRTKWYCSIRQIHLSELANGNDRNDKPIPDNKPNSKPDVYTDKEFLEDWAQSRNWFLKKPTHISKLNISESINLQNAIRDGYNREMIREAIRGLFTQEKIEFSSMTLRPTHFLDRIETYYNAFKSSDKTLYGKKQKTE